MNLDHFYSISQTHLSVRHTIKTRIIVGLQLFIIQTFPSPVMFIPLDMVIDFQMWTHQLKKNDQMWIHQLISIDFNNLQSPLKMNIIHIFEVGFKCVSPNMFFHKWTNFLGMSEWVPGHSHLAFHWNILTNIIATRIIVKTPKNEENELSLKIQILRL